MHTSDYHVHSYETRTSCADGHTHCLSGITGNTIPGGGSHVHYYSGVTTFNKGHVHYYAGVSGPAIYLPGGGHTHSYCGTTTFDNGHAHLLRGKTSLASVREDPLSLVEVGVYDWINGSEVAHFRTRLIL